MNLPPVPNSSVPSPSLPPVPRSSPASSSPEPTPSSGNSKARVVLIVGGFVVVAAAVVIGLMSPPSDQRIQGFAISEIKKEGVNGLYTSIVNRTNTPKRITTVLTVSGTRGDGAGYVEVRGPFQDPTGVDPAFDFPTWQRIKDLVGGENGARLIQLAGFGSEESALAGLTLLREVKSGPAMMTAQVTVIAERETLRWKLTAEKTSLLSQSGTNAPQSISAFSGKIFVLDRPNDRAELAALSKRLPEIQSRLERAAAAQFAQDRTQLLASLKPRALFAGTAQTQINRTLETTRVYLEITEVRLDEEPASLSVLLRNGGSWKETRLFSGAVIYNAATGNVQLRLRAPYPHGMNGAGPFLEDSFGGFFLERENSNSNSILSLALENGALTWSYSGAKLRLEPVPAENRAAVIAEAEGDFPRMVEATGVGAIYAGVITNRTTGSRQNWILRFKKPGKPVQDDEAVDASLSAVLEHPENPAVRCGLYGQVEANRYRAKETPIKLRPNNQNDESLPAEMREVLRVNNDRYGDAPLALRLEGTKLVGENARFVFRFERLAGESLAEQQRRDGERADRLLAFVQVGAIHDGTLERTGLSAPAPVRLRITRMENRGERVEAILYSPARPHFSTPLFGVCDLESSKVNFTFSGSGPVWPAGPLMQDPDLIPYFRQLIGYQGFIDMRMAVNDVSGAMHNENERRSDDWTRNDNRIREQDDQVTLHFKPSTKEQAAGLQQNEAARRSRLLAFVQAGAVNQGGLERTGISTPGPVLLRILKVDERAFTLEALLVSAAHPRYATRLAGRYDLAAGVVRLQVASSSGVLFTPLAEDPDLAPYFRDLGGLSAGNETGFWFDSDATVGTLNRFSSSADARLKFRFPNVSAERAAALQRSELDSQARVQAFLQVGTVHDGVVERGGTQPGRLRVRWLKFSEGYEGLEAVVYSPNRPQYGARLVGTYESGARGVQLRFTGNSEQSLLPLGEDPELVPYFRAGVAGISARVFLEGDSLTGWFDNGNPTTRMTLRFQPSTPERLTQLKQEEAAHEQRWREQMQSGATFEGKIVRASGSTIPVRLRLIRVANEHVDVVLESTERPEIGWKANGSLNHKSHSLRLSTAGYIKTIPKAGDPQAGPGFDAYNSPMSLAMGTDSLTGTAGQLGATKLIFAVKP